jgi:hypothetical protein
VDEHANTTWLADSHDAHATTSDNSPDVSVTHKGSKQVVPIWCPVANMTSERPYGPGGQITKRGSKHFAPGAKLYFRHVMGYLGDPQLEVVGRHRGSHRFVTMIVSLSWLENWRVDLVYSPKVAKELRPYWDGTPASNAQAEYYVQKYLNEAF